MEMRALLGSVPATLVVSALLSLNLQTASLADDQGPRAIMGEALLQAAPEGDPPAIRAPDLQSAPEVDPPTVRKTPNRAPAQAAPEDDPPTVTNSHERD